MNIEDILLVLSIVSLGALFIGIARWARENSSLPKSNSAWNHQTHVSISNILFGTRSHLENKIGWWLATLTIIVVMIFIGLGIYAILISFISF
ncbi:MAG: hypothetical protein KIT18_11345 [Burkholderiales bacterium]|nr:hypothetical protein [Burkholderiales bacterium]